MSLWLVLVLVSIEVLYWASAAFGFYSTITTTWLLNGNQTFGLFLSCREEVICSEYEAGNFSLTASRILVMASLFIGVFGQLLFGVTLRRIIVADEDWKILKTAKLVPWLFTVSGVFHLFGMVAYTSHFCRNSCDNYKWGFTYYSGWLSAGLILIAAPLTAVIAIQRKSKINGYRTIQ